MAEQLKLMLKSDLFLVRGRERRQRRSFNPGPPPVQLAIDFTVVYIRIPRKPKRSTIFAGSTLVTLNGESMPAMEWAAKRGLKWQTVKMRRLRGDNWTEAMAPDFKRRTFNAFGGFQAYR